MRLEKTIVIDGKEIKVKELSAKDIYQAKIWFEETEFLANILVGDYDTMLKVWKNCIELPEGTKLEDLVESANNYTKVLEAFKEVNKDFFVQLPTQMEAVAMGGK